MSKRKQKKTVTTFISLRADMILLYTIHILSTSWPWTHWPAQKHNCVNFKFDLKHLHLAIHDFLQLHFNSSQQLFETSGRDFNVGVHSPSSAVFSQPQSEGEGSDVSLICAWPQTWPPGKLLFSHAGIAQLLLVEYSQTVGSRAQTVVFVLHSLCLSVTSDCTEQL